MTGFPQFLQSVVVYDLEYTAWEGSMANRWLRPGEFTEVVQIGAVRVDSQTLEEIDVFQALVRPRVNSKLSVYLEELTGISNAQIARSGRDFLEAFCGFAEFAERACLFSFGRDDLVLDATLRLYGITDAPTLPVTTNIAPWLIEHGVEVRGWHACDVARLAGTTVEGRAHDALDDARSVVVAYAPLSPAVARCSREV